MMCSSSRMCSREDEFFTEEDETPMLEGNVLGELFSSMISTSSIVVVSSSFDGVWLVLNSFCNTIDSSVRTVFDSLNNYCQTINLKPANLAVLPICFFAVRLNGGSLFLVHVCSRKSPPDWLSMVSLCLYQIYQLVNINTASHIVIQHKAFTIR